MRRVLERPRAVAGASQPAAPQRILDGADGVCVLGPEVRLPCLFEMAGIVGIAAGGEDVGCCQRGDDGWCEGEELVDKEGDNGVGDRSIIIVDIVVGCCAGSITGSDSLSHIGSISSGENDVRRQESDDRQQGQKSPAGAERDGEGEEEGDGARPGNAVVKSAIHVIVVLCRFLCKRLLLPSSIVDYPRHQCHRIRKRKTHAPRMTETQVDCFKSCQLGINHNPRYSVWVIRSYGPETAVQRQLSWKGISSMPWLEYSSRKRTT